MRKESAMSLAITCPHCGHTAHTEKQVDVGSAVRCPKCKRTFDVSDESIEKGREFVSQKRALPVPDAESGAGEAPSTRIVDDDDARTDGHQTEDDEARDPDTKEGLFTALPVEPWFYGYLWSSGQALRFVADGGAVLFTLWCFLAFMDIGGMATSVANTGLAIAGLVSALFVVGLVWFILRLVSAAALLMVDTARNIRNTLLATEHAHLQ